MLNDKRSHGLWEMTAPPPPPTAALAQDITVDVAVVGAGFTGLSAALHLAEAGSRVAVLEAAEIGFGGSGRNVGLVNAGLWVLPDDIPKALGEEYGQRLLGLLGDAPKTVFELIERHRISCDVQRTGTLHCGVGDAGKQELEERCRQWTARGAPVRLLDAAAAASLIGSTAYSAALLDLRAGTIQPLAYVRGLARAAIAAGARVYTRTPAVSAERNAVRWEIKTPAGKVTAHWVVVATNAYTKTPWTEIEREIVKLPYFNFATEPLSDNLRREILPERQGAWDTKTILSSFRFDKHDRLIFGSVGALRGTGTAIHRSWSKRALKRIFPQLGDVALSNEWFGWIGMTGDSLPRFHRLAPNVVSFSGYNGRGIGPGTVFGKVLAELIVKMHIKMPLPESPVQGDPLRSVKSAYYEYGAQIAHIAEDRF
ncbi:FAD-binding oxidoreductase [soil metagenome]